MSDDPTSTVDWREVLREHTNATPAMADALADAGYDSVDAILQADPGELAEVVDAARTGMTHFQAALTAALAGESLAPPEPDADTAVATDATATPVFPADATPSTTSATATSTQYTPADAADGLACLLCAEPVDADLAAFLDHCARKHPREERFLDWLHDQCVVVQCQHPDCDIEIGSKPQISESGVYAAAPFCNDHRDAVLPFALTLQPLTPSAVADRLVAFNDDVTDQGLNTVRFDA